MLPKKLVRIYLVLSAALPLTTGNAAAQGIEQLLINRIPIPSPRPAFAPTVLPYVAEAPVQVPVTAANSGIKTASVAGVTASPKVAPISGSLKDGLTALASKKVNRARAIRSGMRTGSLDRKILAWSIALSGQPEVSSGEIAQIATQMRDWPGQTALRINMEKAIARETSQPAAIINAFATSNPISVTGGLALAKAHLATGNRKAARAAIAPFWREDTLSKSLEKKILDGAGKALTRADHRHRMHRMFYRERASAANRVAPYAEQASLARARTAVVRKSADAAKKLNAVAASSRRDPGYLFARIKQARRSKNYREAAKLMLSAPRDRAALVHPDEWWIEQRIISRHMLDLGDARTAYKLAARHSAKSPAKRAEAEFHAGWYALRFLNDSKLARGHFQNILKVSSRPISQARAYYWLARAFGTGGTKYYREAAKHSGTFYGQLAAAKLRQSGLSISQPRPSGTVRATFSSRELVRTIKRLEESGFAWRADIIYRELAKKLDSAGELALLSARAEKRGNPTLALQIGKIAHGRGLPVDTLSWPIGAIPGSAKIGTTGKALAYAIARQESAFNKAAVSPANARGLLQLLPGTAKQMARKKGISYSYKRLTRDAGYNATLGAAYLSEQLDNFGNSYIFTFAGYNAGPRRVREWIAKYGDPRGKSIEAAVDWIERIPFTETRNYVQRVMENYQVYKARLSRSPLTIVSDLRYGRK